MQGNNFSVYLTVVDKTAPAQRQKPLYICLSFRGRYKENLSVAGNQSCFMYSIPVISMLLLASESSDKPKVFNTSKRTDNSQIPRLALQPSLSPNVNLTRRVPHISFWFIWVEESQWIEC